MRLSSPRRGPPSHHDANRLPTGRVKRFRLASILLVLTLAVAVAVWTGFREAGGQTAMLSDGTRLTLRAALARTNASMSFGSPFRRMATRVPLAAAQKWGNQSLRRLHFGETNLALWFTSTPTAPRAAQYQFRIVDDAGTSPVRFLASASGRIPSREIATCFYTPLWPRRSEFFTVQAFADVRPLPEKPEWEFRVRNPAFADYPQWQPEQFPSARTVGETEFTLQELPRAPNANATAVDVRLRITCGGQPCDDWAVCGLQFRDATGNRVQTTPGDVTRTGPGRWWARVPCPLFAGESAARIGLGFVRRVNVPTNDVVVLRGVPLQLMGENTTTRMIPASIMHHPLLGQVNVSVVAQPRPAGTPLDYWAYVASAEPYPRDLSKTDTRWFFVVGATDDWGRVVPVSLEPLGSESNRRLTVSEGTQSVDLIVAASRVVFLEWTASRAQLAAGRP